MSLVEPGSPIAVIAPCGAYDPARFERGIELARAAGHELVPLPGLLDPKWYLAADDERRLEHLHLALSSPDWGAVWIARGGYGLTRILDRLELGGLEGKPVIGFSDVTALHMALQKADLGPAIHGPVVHSLPITDDASLQHLWDLLAGRPLEPLRGETWIDGDATGPLTGGNLCLLAATCGTPLQCEARGSILVLEDVGEPAYRIDRMVQQLVSAGVFAGVAGVALGEFHSCRVPSGVEWTLREILVEHLEPLGVPVAGRLPIGHGAANRAFVYGSGARLSDGVLTLDL